MDITIKFYNQSYVYIECEDSTFYELRDYFSFNAEGYLFNPKYKMGVWDGKIRLLEFNRLLPIGLAKHVRKFASTMDYDVWIDPQILEEEPLTRFDFDEWIKTKEIYSGSTKIDPHWYQADATYKALKERKAILNLPTSAGKSLIQCLLSRYYVEHYEGKVLILVPTVSLVTQMKRDFVDYRLFPSGAIAEMRAGKKAGDELIVVSTWQTAIKQPKGWLSQFGMVLCDEMHLSTGKSISTIIKGLDNCIFKAGLSGSLKDGKANLMQYIGMFGDVYKPVSTSDLMEDGQVTDLKINAIMLRYPEEVIKLAKGRPYPEEIKIITGYKRRNSWVVNLSAKLASRNENVFLMFKNVAHGKALYEELKLKHPDKEIHYVSGEVKSDVRTTLQNMAESSKGMIIVASYGVFSTGISIKNLHHVVLGHPVKSPVIIKQTIGRVLRKHDSKSIATVWDIIDDLSVVKQTKEGKTKRSSLNYALKHGVQRIEIYAAEKFNYVLKNVQL